LLGRQSGAAEVGQGAHLFFAVQEFLAILSPSNADLTIILQGLPPGPGYPLPKRPSPRNGHQGTVKMTVARDADDAFMHLRTQAAHILEQALEIEVRNVRRTLLQQSFELLRLAQVAEVGAGLARVAG